MFLVECLCSGHTITESLAIKNKPLAQHFTQLGIMQHQITLTLLAGLHLVCMDRYSLCATSQIFRLFGFALQFTISSFPFPHFINEKTTDLLGTFSLSSFLQSAQPDCSSHGGLPVMASSGQPLDLYPGWHTPASLALGLSVPAAGGGSQWNCEATWDTVWTQTQEELTWQRK